MKRRAIPKRQNVTVAANRVAAFAKAGTAPLDKLTDANLQSIARSHCGRGPGAFDALLAELRDMVDARKAMVR